MSEPPIQTGSVPLADYPGPACSYTFADGEPVVQATNDAFDDVFGRTVEETAIPAALEQFDIHLDGATSLPGRLERGEQFRVQAPGDSGGYIVQTVTPTESETGFLLFVETDTPVDSPGALGIDHVASVVSHDLRNPLDVAKARLEAGRELDEDQHFDHVEQAHERMERIIQDVLTIARGAEVVDPDETVDLTGVAETAWGTVETNGATLHIEAELPTAIADSDRVGRLFENLFRNCVEHGSGDASTNPNGGAVTVRVGRLDDHDGFYVADDGPGIPSDERERVLEPGYSSDDHGTGLGLAIVARIADIHGWSLAVTDSEAGGARIEVGDVDPA